MQTARLGRTGLVVSRLCLGTMSFGDPSWRRWVLREEDSRPFIQRALELGINFFDTANMYSLGRSEEVLGRALRDFARREDVVIATKVYFPMGPGPNDRGLSRKHILSAIDHSLRRLGTDHVDLYQIHRWDHETPIEETMEALHDVVRAGKARYLGASSMYAWQFSSALCVAEQNGWTPFVSMQNHYNLAYREEEREMMPLCRARRVGVLPWSPLARGLLTGNRSRGNTYATTRAEADDYGHRLYNAEPDFQVADRVAEVASARDIPRAHVALAWLLRQPGVTAPIIGATKLAQLEEAVGAVDVTLSDEECTRLEAPYQPHRVLGHD